MTSVNWDEPSSGVVSDAAPALALQNAQGSALTAVSGGIALLSFTPEHTAVLGVNQAGNASIGGVNLTDPAIPDVTQNPKGIGVLGATDRFDAIGAAGLAVGPRSVGVHGEALSGVGVHGVGSDGGVEGTASAGPGVAGFTQHAGAAGVYGFGPGQKGAGVRGEGIAGPGVDAHSTAGPGVRALSDQAQGVIAEAKAANAAGVFGRNDHASGVGVDGFSQSGTAVRGTSTNGTAIAADCLSGRAVDASTLSQTEPAIGAFTMQTPAVDASSFNGPGVEAFSLTGPGIRGGSASPADSSDSAIGAGVFGNSLVAAGVCGTTLTGTGVLGISLPGFGPWAGRFHGNVLVGGDVYVDGTVFKQACFFSIDHPLDPGRKVLNHAAVEAPEYKNFYDGVVTLDARGTARVKLPRWFEALNGEELRYQLTPMGAPAPELHVAQEIKEGRFVIAGGAPRQKVCWQVTGVRQDTWARENPLKVEQPRRAARPEVASPSAADLERHAAALKEGAAALRKKGTERERTAKARRPPEPLAAPPVLAPPVSDPAPLQIAEQMVATAHRLTERGTLRSKPNR